MSGQTITKNLPNEEQKPTFYVALLVRGKVRTAGDKYLSIQLHGVSLEGDQSRAHIHLDWGFVGANASYGVEPTLFEDIQDADRLHSEVLRSRRFINDCAQDWNKTPENLLGPITDKEAVVIIRVDGKYGSGNNETEVAFNWV